MTNQGSALSSPWKPPALQIAGLSRIKKKKKLSMRRSSLWRTNHCLRYHGFILFMFSFHFAETSVVQPRELPFWPIKTQKRPIMCYIYCFTAAALPVSCQRRTISAAVKHSEAGSGFRWITLKTPSVSSGCCLATLHWTFICQRGRLSCWEGTKDI